MGDIKFVEPPEDERKRVEKKETDDAETTQEQLPLDEAV